MKSKRISITLKPNTDKRLTFLKKEIGLSKSLLLTKSFERQYKKWESVI